jgi:serine/threonine protein phosphatase PrpC
MHDDLLLEPTHPDCNPTVPLFGVYDGHGGGAAAQHCARRLHHFVAQKLARLLHGAGSGGSAGGFEGAATVTCDGGDSARGSEAGDNTAGGSLTAVGRSPPAGGTNDRAGVAAGVSRGGCGGTGACPLDSEAVVVALREAFVETDAELMRSGVLDNNSGSTALVALLTPASIWLAWAGGCGSVLAGWQVLLK